MAISTPALTSAIVTASVASRHVNNHTPPTVGAEIDITPFLFLLLSLIGFVLVHFSYKLWCEEKENKKRAKLIQMKIKMLEAEAEKKRKEKEELKRTWEQLEKEYGNEQ